MKTTVAPLALEKRKVSRWERLSMPYKLLVWPRVQAVASGCSDLVVAILRLEQRRWYRKRKGGKWERWYVDHPVVADLWHPVERWTMGRFERPSPLCRGRPTLEEDGLPLYENRCGKCDAVAEVSTKQKSQILCTACDVLWDVD
jgi:hypothetical protein